ELKKYSDNAEMRQELLVVFMGREAEIKEKYAKEADGSLRDLENEAIHFSALASSLIHASPTKGILNIPP
ncbi:unnamed protein product, partial [marine sediment metagenome]